MLLQHTAIGRGTALDTKYKYIVYKDRYNEEVLLVQWSDFIVYLNTLYNNDKVITIKFDRVHVWPSWLVFSFNK